MKLKQILLAGIAAGAANMAMATTGTITFNGEIVTDTCAVSVDGASSTIVTLPTVQTSSLNASGLSTGTTNFSLYVKNCGDAVDARGITLTFTDPNGFDTTNNNLLKNFATATPATNVGIELATGSDFAAAIVFAGAPYTTPTHLTSSGAVTLPFSARYTATGVATAGAVSSTMDWTITYK